MNLYYLNNNRSIFGNHSNYFTNKKDTNIKKKECMKINNNFINCEPNIIYGSSHPINEKCILITGQLRDGPNDNCSSIWNNLTKRKTLVKDNRI